MISVPLLRVASDMKAHVRAATTLSPVGVESGTQQRDFLRALVHCRCAAAFSKVSTLTDARAAVATVIEPSITRDRFRISDALDSTHTAVQTRRQSILRSLHAVESGRVCSDDTRLRHPCRSHEYDLSLSKREAAAEELVVTRWQLDHDKMFVSSTNRR